MRTTESSGSARTQGPRTTLEFTPVQEPEPAVDSDSEERTDMSMFVINSAQVTQSNWMVDSGAGMSGTSSTINLKDTMRCRIPITPAFGEVMNATSEGLIREILHSKSLVSRRYILNGCIIICCQYIRYVQGENPAKSKSVSSHRRDASSFRCPSARRHSRLCQSATTLSMD